MTTLMETLVETTIIADAASVENGSELSEQQNLRKESEGYFAKIKGEPLLNLPKDLYIPPEALEVFLETFEGPLDLLLYLIKRQNLDILDIPMAKITHQYMDYVELMKQFHLELAAEYLVMAAMLVEIKSRMLLPRPAEALGEEEDPRAELVRRLQEYERFKKAAEELDQLPRINRDIFNTIIDTPELTVNKPLPTVELKELLLVFSDVMQRATLLTHHHVQREALSVRERMGEILAGIKSDQFTRFSHFFKIEEGRMGVVVTFIAILELIREALIEIVQSEPFGPIHVKAIS